MSKQPFEPAAERDEHLEERLHAAAERFQYPPSPDIANSVRQRLTGADYVPRTRHWAVWAALIILVSLCALAAVPGVRAAVVDFLRLGGVIILPNAPTATPTGLTPTPGTATPSVTPVQSILDLAGGTTLSAVQKAVTFPIRLPTYPATLGAPDRVFLQDVGGPLVVLVWLDSTQPNGIRFALHILGPGTFVYKMEPTIIGETTVHGRQALWTEGPYFLEWRTGNSTTWDMRRIVTGNVLIWADDQLTYRLESAASLAETLKVAESIPPVKP